MIPPNESSRNPSGFLLEWSSSLLLLAPRLLLRLLPLPPHPPYPLIPGPALLVALEPKHQVQLGPNPAQDPSPFRARSILHPSSLRSPLGPVHLYSPLHLNLARQPLQSDLHLLSLVRHSLGALLSLSRLPFPDLPRRPLSPLLPGAKRPRRVS